MSGKTDPASTWSAEDYRGEGIIEATHPRLPTSPVSESRPGPVENLLAEGLLREKFREDDLGALREGRLAGNAGLG